MRTNTHASRQSLNERNNLSAEIASRRQWRDTSVSYPMIHSSDHPTKISYQSKLQRIGDSSIQLPRGQVALSRGDALNLSPRPKSTTRIATDAMQLLLLPVTCNPDPAARTANPMAFYPHSGRPWSHHPTAGYPYVIGSGPSPITTCPDIPRPGCHLCFDSNGRRSPGHYHLSGWTSCCHFLRSCCRCHCRWFLSAADEEMGPAQMHKHLFSYEPPRHEFVLHSRLRLCSTWQ